MVDVSDDAKGSVEGFDVVCNSRLPEISDFVYAQVLQVNSLFLAIDVLEHGVFLRLLGPLLLQLNLLNYRGVEAILSSFERFEGGLLFRLGAD